MNRSIVGRHFELTDPIKSYADSAIDSLDKYNLDIISATTLVSSEEKNGKKGFMVEFVINLKDKNTIVISQKDKDVYGAIDLAIERVKKTLRRHSDKIKNHKVMGFKDLGVGAEAVGEIKTEEEEIEVVPMDLSEHKPIDFDEAVQHLKDEKNRQFIVFNDVDGNMRVMYKRADGKFGLY
jgi:putative sigma-54 modulation protein